ncbi:hypothetical protein SAMN04488542_10560 [Fontibacillus panacisegetis]|uniref:Uncharacterized protein n=1 Tax=Fontibacillus panacisegetis TaxID=670482 RepID=A0A1G7HWA8_9BACL|nr:hypothetical protein [Fontibacillus panacisegetis]SDF04732.1 hypothetical protein SAMN04488542_10560 [Fontibacillus panacisegetis]
MNEIARKAGRDLLETTKKLCQLNNVIRSEPIEGIIDDMDRIVYELLDIQLDSFPCPDCIHETVHAYHSGEIGIDECLDYIAELKEELLEDRR